MWLSEGYQVCATLLVAVAGDEGGASSGPGGFWGVTLLVTKKKFWGDTRHSRQLYQNYGETIKERMSLEAKRIMISSHSSYLHHREFICLPSDARRLRRIRTCKSQVK